MKKARTPREAAPSAAEDDLYEEDGGAGRVVEGMEFADREASGDALSLSSAGEELENLDAVPLATFSR